MVLDVPVIVTHTLRAVHVHDTFDYTIDAIEEAHVVFVFYVHTRLSVIDVERKLYELSSSHRYKLDIVHLHGQYLIYPQA